MYSLPLVFNKNYDEYVLTHRLASPTDIVVIFYRTKLYNIFVLKHILSFLWEEYISTIPDKDLRFFWKGFQYPFKKDNLHYGSFYIPTTGDDDGVVEDLLTSGITKKYAGGINPIVHPGGTLKYLYFIYTFNGMLHTPKDRVQKYIRIKPTSNRSSYPRTHCTKLQAYHMGTLYFEAKSKIPGKSDNKKDKLTTEESEYIKSKMIVTSTGSTFWPYEEMERDKKANRILKKQRRYLRRKQKYVRKRVTELKLFKEQKKLNLIHMRALKLIREDDKIWKGIVNKTSTCWEKNDWCHRLQKFKVLMK